VIKKVEIYKIKLYIKNGDCFLRNTINKGLRVADIHVVRAMGDFKNRIGF
jgi:predicted DNA-binding protein (UPF0278 family)